MHIRVFRRSKRKYLAVIFLVALTGLIWANFSGEVSDSVVLPGQDKRPNGPPMAVNAPRYETSPSPDYSREITELEDEPVVTLVTHQSLQPIYDSSRLKTHVIPAALEKQPAAEMQLFSTMEACDEFFETYPKNVAELDAFLARRERGLGGLYDEIKVVHGACSDLYQDPRVKEIDQDALLKDSLEKNFPPAYYVSAIRFGSSGNYEMAELYLHRALFSKHPEAVWLAGEALTSAPVFRKDGTILTDELKNLGMTPSIKEVAWLTVACSLGMDCGQNSELWLKYCSSSCSASDSLIVGVARSRGLTSDDLEASAELAGVYIDAINRKDKLLFSLIPPD